jgi:hypothetical protein
MKTGMISGLCLCLVAGGVLASQTPAVGTRLDVRSEPESPAVFCGPERLIRLVLRNTGATPVSLELHARVHQLSSATAVHLGDITCKRLNVLAGQTVLDSVSLSFPDVRGETRFLVQWVEATNRVLGTTEVLVYPPDLLNELKTLAGDRGVGVFDSLDVVRPLLRLVRAEFVDLSETGFDRFSGKLAIIGPFAPEAGISGDLVNRIDALAHRGVGLVWIQAPPGPSGKLRPSFYAVPTGKGTVVVVQDAVLSDLRHQPRAQLNLLHLCGLALDPEPPRLPRATMQP